MLPTAARGLPPKSAAPAIASELTLRAVAAGCLIGIVLAVANVYMSLKTGWSDSGNVTASILGFALFSACRGLTKTAYSPLENSITQTVATSVGAMAVAGLASSVPALELLGHHYPGWAIALWISGVGLVGVVLAALLRQRLFESEGLPFPTGTVTAELIRTMHKTGATAVKQVRTLLMSAGAAALITWLRDAKPSLVPQVTFCPGKLRGFAAPSLGLGIAWSPMLFGAGMLVGGHLGISLLCGAGVAWMGLAPWLVHAGIVQSVDYSVLVGWLLWPGVALMVAASMAGLVLDWRTFARGAGARMAKVLSRSRRWLFGGCALVAGAVAAIGWRVFGVSPWIVLLSMASSAFLVRLAAHAVGETDIDPLGTNAQLIQIGFAGVAPGQAVPNLFAATVVQAMETQTTQTLWNLKAGAVLGANPRRLLWAQAIGVGVGALVAVPAYLLMVRAYGLGSARLPAPGALSAKAMAEGLAKGGAALPPHAASAMGIAALVGVMLTLLGRTRMRRFVPSPMALSVGFLVPAYYAVIIAAGAGAGELLRARWPRWASEQMSSLAAGAIAGEALVGVLVAALMVTGVLGGG